MSESKEDEALQALDAAMARHGILRSDLDPAVRKALPPKLWPAPQPPQPPATAAPARP